MLRLSSILQLQSVWETIPPQSSQASSPETLSRNTSVHIQPAALLTSAISLVLEDNSFSTSSSSSSSSSSSLPERSSSLPTPSVSPPPSVRGDDSQHPENECVHSDALFHEVDQIHPLATTSLVYETPQKEPIKRLHSSPDINATSTEPSPPQPTPPQVPRKDSIYRLLAAANKPSKTNNKVSDSPQPTTDKKKKKEKRSSKYGFFGSRSAATATATAPPLPSPVSSMIPSPTPSPPPNQLIDGANKTLRQETSKFNLRRRSFSKKVKRAISTIKLNGTGDTTLPPPLPSTISN